MEDYKQKYEDALERAKCYKGLRAEMSIVFPELKESEDEKIRKEIISFLKDGEPYHCPNSTRRQEWVTWLEKQSEQKPIDKIEPKFKVGDYVVGKYISGYISEVRDDCYLLGYQGFSIDKQDNYHLWTIQDAEDGDVLATDNDSICVFDGTVEDGKYPFAYCGLTKHHEFEVYDRRLPFTHDKNIYPATKEQRDLLFQKMKEAGYEWDAEKKELKKIKQKSVWSEEDERICQYLIKDQEEALNKVKNSKYGHSEIISDLKEVYRERIDWLKFLRQRMKGE